MVRIYSSFNSKTPFIAMPLSFPPLVSVELHETYQPTMLIVRIIFYLRCY